MRLDATIDQLSSGQHGCVAVWQLRALGADETEIVRLYRGSGWDRASARVLVRTGLAMTDRRGLMAAVLDASPGAAVSGSTAAAFWALPGYKVNPIHVVRHRGVSRRPSRLAIVHEVVDLLPHHIKVVDGVPVISPARVICELAGRENPARVERNLEWLWRERLLDGRTFRRVVVDLAARGRKGSTVCRQLDQARGPGYVPHASGLEMRFAEILERDGQRPMRRQVDSGTVEEWCGRVDFRDESLPLVVEIQSERYHRALVDRVADQARVNRLESAGLVVQEFTDTEVWHHPNHVVRTVRQRRSELRRPAPPFPTPEPATH